MKNFIALRIFGIFSIVSLSLFFVPAFADVGASTDIVAMHQLDAYDIFSADLNTGSGTPGFAVTEWNKVPLASVLFLEVLPLEYNDPYLYRSQRWIRERNLQANADMHIFVLNVSHARLC